MTAHVNGSQHLVLFTTDLRTDVRPAATTDGGALVQLAADGYLLHLSVSDEQAADIETKLREHRESREAIVTTQAPAPAEAVTV